MRKRRTSDFACLCNASCWRACGEGREGSASTQHTYSNRSEQAGVAHDDNCYINNNFNFNYY